MSRLSWPEYFMKIAERVSLRGTCDRKQVGAILVLDNEVVATGYNGSLPGMPHCDDVGHDMQDGHCVRTVHAEENAVAQAARRGRAIQRASLYSNTFPCWMCFRLLASARIGSIYYDAEYRIDDRVISAAEHAGSKRLGPKDWMPGVG